MFFVYFILHFSLSDDETALVDVKSSIFSFIKPYYEKQLFQNQF
jgi:hypothetical protein